jgi:hypothetical protein
VYKFTRRFLPEANKMPAPSEGRRRAVLASLLVVLGLPAAFFMARKALQLQRGVRRN